jgi:hypothetical protein
LEEELLGRKINLLERGNQMFDKKQVQAAIKEIDENLASLTGPRQAHLALTKDVQLVQAVCMAYFEAEEEIKEFKKDIEDVRTDKPTEHTEPGDKDS